MKSNEQLFLSTCVSFNSKSMGIACAAGTANPYGAPAITHFFREVCVARSLVFCEVLCRSLFVVVYASYQVSVHMAKQFQRRRFFRNRSIRNKNCMWWPCLSTDRDEVSKHGHHRQFLFLIGRFKKNLLLRNRLAK
jgi:hypothetical protein